MGTVNIDDIVVTPLKQIPVEGGNVLHAMKFTDVGYVGFGEAYFSMIEKGAVKAWKRHLRMTLNLIVPFGSVRFVFIDESGNQRIEIIGESRYVRLTVPPGMFFGFQGLAEQGGLILNIADITHDPEEVERIGIEEIDFNWMNGN